METPPTSGASAAARGGCDGCAPLEYESRLFALLASSSGDATTNSPTSLEHATETSVREVQRSGIERGEFGVGIVAGARWRAANALHAPAIAAIDGLRLRGVSDEFHASRRVRAYRLERCTRTALLARADVDVVVVASRAEHHFDDAKAALLAGKHAIVELPLARTLADVEELVAIAAVKGALLMELPVRRADADFRAVQRWVESGALGELRTVERAAEVPRPLLWTTGTELVDQLVALLGAPTAISAESSGGSSGFALVLSYAAGSGAAPRTVHLRATSSAASEPTLEADRAFAVRWELHGASGSLLLREPDAPRELPGGAHDSPPRRIVGAVVVEPGAQRTEIELCTNDDCGGSISELHGAVLARLRNPVEGAVAASNDDVLRIPRMLFAALHSALECHTAPV